MGLIDLRFLSCVVGVYSCFLIWGIVQEKLSQTPYTHPDGGDPQYFTHVVFLNTVQSLFSCMSAVLYIYFKSSKVPSISKPLLKEYAKLATVNSLASPFGFASLRHISFPTMVLGKSCKLVPVMFMNIALYRVRYKLHNYVVVALVTLGISMFMLLAPSKKFGHGGSASPSDSGSSLFGIGLLLINLLLDGATNSTQDQIFKKFKVQGGEMMFFMNMFATLLTFASMVLPLPAIPYIHDGGGRNELRGALSFISTHPKVLKDILLFSITGALGQLFIFETLEKYGSLKLVTITVTRKLFTMLLSIFFYNHRLSLGQWAGTAVVFTGIGYEAYIKMQEIKAKNLLKTDPGTREGTIKEKSL